MCTHASLAGTPLLWLWVLPTSSSFGGIHFIAASLNCSQNLWVAALGASDLNGCLFRVRSLGMAGILEGPSDRVVVLAYVIG